MARIALDAMGGDFAPQATVAGALLALAELDPAHSIQLVGQTAVVEAHLRDLLDGDFAAAAIHRDRLSIVDATEVIEEAAIRREIAVADSLKPRGRAVRSWCLAFISWLDAVASRVGRRRFAGRPCRGGLPAFPGLRR